MTLPEFYVTQYFMLIPAILIFLFLTFLEKRNVGRNICGGRPGLITPIPYIDGYENRVAYAMAFGVCLITALRTIILNEYLGFDIPMFWMKAFYSLFQALFVCIITLPFCVTISTRYRAAGAIINIMYSVAWLAINIAYLFQMIQKDQVIRQPTKQLTIQPTEQSHEGYPEKLPPRPSQTQLILSITNLMVMVPYLFCQSVLIFYCFYILYRCCKSWSFISQNIPGVVKPHQVLHVRWVLRKNKDKEYMASLTEPHMTFVSQMKKSRKLRLITNLPFFKYPSKIWICVVFQLTTIFLFNLAVVKTILLIEEIKQQSDQFLKMIRSENFIENLIAIAILILLEFAKIIEGVAGATVIVTNINTLSNIWLMYRNYRYHLLKLYQGEKDFIVDWKLTPQYTVASSMNSIGYIMAFSFAGWILCFITLFLILLFVTLCFNIFIIIDQLDKLLENIAGLVCFVLVAQALMFALTMISKKFLLQMKLHSSKKNLPLNLDNRKVYETISYFFLYVSMTRSLTFYLWRLILTATFGLLSLDRLDKTIFAKDKQRFDITHGTYIAMLKIDHAHNNPSMRLFAHLLWSEILVARLRNSGGSQTELARLVETLNHSPGLTGSTHKHAHVSDVNSESHNVEAKSKLARTRWFLAYTLIRNPQLASLRRNGTLDHSEPRINGINIQVTDASPLFNSSSSV